MGKFGERYMALRQQRQAFIPAAAATVSVPISKGRGEAVTRAEEERTAPTAGSLPVRLSPAQGRALLGAGEPVGLPARKVAPLPLPEPKGRDEKETLRQESRIRSQLAKGVSPGELEERQELREQRLQNIPAAELKKRQEQAVGHLEETRKALADRTRETTPYAARGGTAPAGGLPYAAGASVGEQTAEDRILRGELDKWQGIVNDLSARYYYRENEEKAAELAGDQEGQSRIRNVEDILADLRVLGEIATGQYGDQRDREALMAKYGLSERELEGQATALIQRLQGELERAKEEAKAAGYDYDRMTGYQERKAQAMRAAEGQRHTEEFAREHPVLSSAASILAGPAQGVDYLGQLAKGYGYSDPEKLESYVPANVYEMRGTNFVRNVRETVARGLEEKYGWRVGDQNVASFLYQTGMSMGDFLFNAMITGNFSGGLGGAGSELGRKAASDLSLAIMGSGAAANTTAEAIERGLSNRQAYTLGAIAGVAEIITEKVSLETLLDKTALDRSARGYLLKNILAEGSEEMASDLINWAGDVLVAKDQSQWSQAIQGYMAQGMGEKEAFQMALKDQLIGMAWSGLGGGLSGGVMAGGRIAIGSAMESYQNRGPEVMQAEKTASLGETVSLTPYSQHEAQNFLTGAKNKVLGFGSDILEFAKRAILTKGGDERLYCGKLPQETADMIFQSTGRDLSEFNFVISSDGVWHTYDHHGNDTEKTKGRQVSVRAEDMALLPEVIASPDRVVESSRKDGHGRTALIFEKTMGDTVVTITGISAGRRVLDFDSMRIMKERSPAESRADGIIDPSLTSKTSSGQTPLTDTIIPISGDGVKGQYAQEGETYTGKPEPKLLPKVEKPEPKLPPVAGESLRTEEDWGSLMESDTGLGTKKKGQGAPVDKADGVGYDAFSITERGGKWNGQGEGARRGDPQASVELPGLEDPGQAVSGGIDAGRDETVVQVTSGRTGSTYRFRRVSPDGMNPLQSSVLKQGEADGVKVSFALGEMIERLDGKEPGTKSFSGLYLGDGQIILSGDGVSYGHELFHHYEAVHREAANRFSEIVQQQIRMGDPGVMSFLEENVTAENIQSEIAASAFNAFQRGRFETEWDGFFSDPEAVRVAYERFLTEKQGPKPQAERKTPFIQTEQAGEFVDDRTAREKAMWMEAQRRKAAQPVGAEPTYRMTAAMEKLGMEAPSRPITDAGMSESLRASSKAHYEAKRALDKVLRDTHADERARRVAKGIVDGIYTFADADKMGLDRRAMVDIVEAMELERSFNGKNIKAHQERTNWVFDGKVQELIKDAGNWKAPSLVSMNASTMQRTVERMMDPATARAINEEFFEPVLKNEAKRIRFVNNRLDQVRGYNLTAQESAAVQRLMEGKVTLDELRGQGYNTRKLGKASRVMAEMYATFYDAINDFLVAHGCEEIGWQRNYAPHMQEENLNKLQKYLQRLGFSVEVTELPTEIAGRTDAFRPGKQYDPFFRHRTGGEGNIKYDAVGGLESYINYMSNVLYHTDDIQKLRRLSEGIRSKFAEGYLRGELDRLNDLQDRIVAGDTDGIQWEDIQAQKDKLYEEIDKKNRLGGFVSVLDDYTNILAGKQSKLDRAIESFAGRKVLNWGRNIQNAFARSAVMGNLSSAINQTVQLPQLTAEVGSKYVLQAITDVAGGKLGDFSKESTFLTGKRGVQTVSALEGMEVVNNKLSIPFEVVDDLASRIIVRAKYLQQVAQGMDHVSALEAADQYANRLVGSRMKGAKPIVFEQKNPITKLVTTFQLEVANGWEHIFHDLPMEIRETARTQGKAAAVGKTVKLAVAAEVAAFLANLLIKGITGREPVPFDGLGMLANYMASGYGMTKEDYMKAALTGEELPGEFNTGAALEEAGEGIMDNTPFLSNVTTLLGITDGRLPLPQIEGKKLGGAVKDAWTAFTSEDEEERRKAGERVLPQAVEGVAGTVASFLPAGNQLKKTFKALPVLKKGGAYTGSGEDERLKYPVEQSPANIAKGIMFGTSALPETDAYYAEGNKTLTVKETQVYEKLVESGADGQKVYDVMQELKGAKERTDKVDVLLAYDGSRAEKEALFNGMVTETLGGELGELAKQGIPFDTVLKAYKAQYGLMGDKDPKTGETIPLSASRKKKDAVDQVLRGMTRQQKEAVYEAFGISEKVWYLPPVRGSGTH